MFYCILYVGYVTEQKDGQQYIYAIISSTIDIQL